MADSSSAAPVGRRPGGVDTRGEIVGAARGAFVEHGYDGASLRGIARRAEVDASLVHHYFPGGKPELFAAAMYMGGVPHSAAEVDVAGPKGRLVVRSFLSMWEPGPASADQAGGALPFAAFAQAVAASPAAAVAMREFLSDRIWSRVSDPDQPELWQLRHALVASQLMGLGMARYVLCLEPFASASIGDLEGWVGPVVDAALTRSP